MITGTHSIIYTTDPDADRDFLRDVLGLPHVDTGRGWLIFGLPPSEVAVHPADENGRQELYFLVADIKAFMSAMRTRKIACSRVEKARWGLITNVTLPSGGTIGVYEPRHERPPSVRTAGGTSLRSSSTGSRSRSKRPARPRRATANGERRS